MSVRTTASDPKVALYDSVSGVAFGYVFENEYEANEFLDWYQLGYSGTDLRTLSNSRLDEVFKEFYGRNDSVAVNTA